MNAPLTVSQLHNLPNETWVNDGFTGVVKAIEQRTSTKTSKPFWKVTLGEQQGSLTVGCTMFMFPKFKEGNLIEVTGKGIKYKDGQYGREVSFGDKANITILGAAAYPPRRDNDSYGTDRQRPATVDEAIERSDRVEPLAPVFGATVGMAMNNALELLTKGLEHDEVIERIITPEFWKSVWEVSSDQIRVARELEKGRLAPSPTERTKRATGLGSGLRGASAAHPQPDPRDSHPDLEPVTPDPF